MTTFTELKSRVADEIDRTDLTSQIDRELRRAVDHYERERWWFNEAQATAATVASQADYDLPSDALVIDALELTRTSGNRFRLREVSWDYYLDNWRWTTNTSEPQDWAYYADQIWLGAIPNAALTMTIHYRRTLSPASFSDGTDNAWTNQAQDLITARALKTLGSRTLKLGPTELLAYQALESQAYSTLRALNDERTMSGSVKPWSG